MHMMEILPLLGLQTGLTSLPFITSSFMIALFQSATSTPFYCLTLAEAPGQYHRASPI